MSNHSGSHMLNDVLRVLEKESVFDLLGKEKTQDLVVGILKVSRQYDCNPDEILDEMGERVGVCYYCQKGTDEFQSGLCKDCVTS